MPVSEDFSFSGNKITIWVFGFDKKAHRDENVYYLINQSKWPVTCKRWQFFYSASLSFENPSESLLLSGKLPPVFCYGSAFWWEYCVLSLASVSKRLFDFSKIIFLPKTTKRLLLSLFFPLSSFLPRKAESEAIKKQLSWEQREGNLWQLSPADWGSLSLCLPTQSSVVCYFVTWTHPFVKLSFVCVHDVVPAAVCSDKNL